MTSVRVSFLEDRPLLDIRSFARRGPGQRDRLSAEDLALIGRTVGRTPEVMVKVLAKDSNSPKSAARHLNYIGREGKLELETDAGDRPQGEDAGQRLVEDWDLDLDQNRRDLPLTAGGGRSPKLIHKIILSMPPGTPAKGLLQAAHTFAREEFALKHRYALVLHTDEPHPHVHLVVKAVSERGERLNIRKATLRGWRQEFARQLRNYGIAANATERAVRGESRTYKTDGIYRSAERGESSHMRARTQAVAWALRKGDIRPLRNQTLLETRREVERGWKSLIDILARQGHHDLATQVGTFLIRMTPPRTEGEQIAYLLRTPVREPPERTSPLTR